MHPYIHSSNTPNSQDMETTWMSIDRWMDKANVVHMYNGILLCPKNETMPFAATGYKQRLSYQVTEVRRERQIQYDITYRWNPNYETNEFIYITEADSQTQKTDLPLPRLGRDGEGVWDQQIQTVIYKTDKQQGLIVEHRKLYSILC